MYLRIRNRDRKYARMYKNIRCLTGIILLLSGLLLGTICIYSPVAETSYEYRTGQKLQWTVSSIPTKQNGSVRVNDAGKEELETLAGIGSIYASLLIEERENNGLFFYPEDLTAVHGIGRGKLEKIYQDIDLTLKKEE